MFRGLSDILIIILLSTSSSISMIITELDQIQIYANYITGHPQSIPAPLPPPPNVTPSFDLVSISFDRRRSAAMSGILSAII